MSRKHTHTHAHLQPGIVFVLVNTWIIEPDSNTPSLQKESWRRRRRMKREKESRWPSADRLRDWERGVFSEGRGLVLLWLRGLLCHTAYQGSPKSQGLMVSMSPQSSSPALAYCHSCFLISQMQSSVTQTVYLACLPQPGREKEGRKKQTHKPGSRHKIILHNTREFKEALPIPPRTPSPHTSLCSYEKRRGR